jgi:hypothetical protein
MTMSNAWRRLGCIVLALALAAPVMAEPGLYSPNCRKGETFVRVLTWRDSGGALVDLTGYTAKLQIRYPASKTVVITLTQASGLTLGGALGTITWTLSPTQTLTLPIGPNSYDLRMTSGSGVVLFLVYGNLVVQEAITQ